jgi:uncharacterized membrane protein (DUF373 family)
MAHYLVAALLLVLAIAILLVSTERFFMELAFGHVHNFAQSALDYLSDLLFGVIVLELLSTIITYITARKLESTIKDFLVVGLISCVRKILLTGAQSSITRPSTAEFVQESLGSLITIAGICLLIGALLLLDRRERPEDSCSIPSE